MDDVAFLAVLDLGPRLSTPEGPSRTQNMRGFQQACFSAAVLAKNHVVTREALKPDLTEIPEVAYGQCIKQNVALLRG